MSRGKKLSFLLPQTIETTRNQLTWPANPRKIRRPNSLSLYRISGFQYGVSTNQHTKVGFRECGNLSVKIGCQRKKVQSKKIEIQRGVGEKWNGLQAVAMGIKEECMIIRLTQLLSRRLPFFKDTDSAPVDGVHAGSSGPQPQRTSEEEGNWVKVVSSKKKETTPIKVGYSKQEIFKFLGASASLNSDSSSSGLSAKESDAGSRVEIAQPVVVSAEPVATAIAVVQDAPPIPGPTAEEPLAAPTPMMDISIEEAMEWLNDESQLEYPQEGGEVQLLDYGEESETSFARMMGLLGQDKMEDMLRSIPPSEEFKLPDLSNPDVFAQHIDNPIVTPSDSPSVVQRFEKLEVVTTSNSESAKRKSGLGDGDTASSMMVGSSAKRVRHDP